MRGGKMINNWRMVEIFAQEVLDRVLELERWGGLFDRTPEGRISQRAFGAHTYRRLCHVGDRTGLELIRTCQDRLVHTSARVHMEYTLTRLLRDGDRVVGAFGYDRNDGRFIAFQAKAVVLATGGWGRMYRITSNSWEGTGDGADMAYEAGAELIDMEFVQFHPTGMVWPPGARGILVTEAVRGEGGLLRNGKGERFMLDYDPQRKEPSIKRSWRGAGPSMGASTWTSATWARRPCARSCPPWSSNSTLSPVWTSPANRWRWRRPSTTPWAA
jgi:succinate dehydrogenase / fumarate reductase flavoprotein subunit